MIFHNEINALPNKHKAQCEYLGTLISSDGNWYSYLFMSNTEMVQGSYNDMNNKANALGADVVYINNNIDFITSVTLIGQAYNCAIE